MDSLLSYNNINLLDTWYQFLGYIQGDDEHAVFNL